MAEKTLSIFVDESGCFQYPDVGSRFYIVSMVLHDQSVDLSGDLHVLKVELSDFDRVKIYYDCGQTPVTNLLHQTFVAIPSICVEFAQAVRPANYRLFQVADLVCTVRFIAEKLHCGDGMTPSELRFFGGPKEFRHNVLRCLRTKEIV